jgi:hypothetical protein
MGGIRTGASINTGGITARQFESPKCSKRSPGRDYLGLPGAPVVLEFTRAAETQAHG